MSSIKRGMTTTAEVRANIDEIVHRKGTLTVGAPPDIAPYHGPLPRQMRHCPYQKPRRSLRFMN